MNKKGNKNPNFKNISKKIQQEFTLDYLNNFSLSDLHQKYGYGTIVMNRILKDNNITKRDRYGKERNKIISKKVKKHLLEHPEQVEKRRLFHLGRKRPEETRKKLQDNFKNRVKKGELQNAVSKIELKVLKNIQNKTGLTGQSQFQINGDGHNFDMYFSGNLVIEFDGPSHTDPNFWMHKKKDSWNKQQERDQRRLDEARTKNYETLVLTYDDLENKKSGELKSDLYHFIIGNSGFDIP